MAALLLQNTTIHGQEPYVYMPTDDSQFSPIESFVIVEPKEPIRRTKPVIERVAPEPKFELKSTPKAKNHTVPVSGHKLSGVASWYCKTGTSICTRGHAGGLYAAIRKDLLFLRGRYITVTHGGNSIKVRVMDCNCGPHANLIDLYSDAFRKLAPLGAGRIKVTISW